MARPIVKIDAMYANGLTMRKLADTIAKRQKYLNETAFQSVHATAVNALKSIRTLTKVAKSKGIKVNIKRRADLHFSYSTQNGHRMMCVRDGGGSRMDKTANRIIFEVSSGIPANTVKVFEFVDSDGKSYIIASISTASAKARAQKIVAKRILAYAGLARMAVSALIVKTNSSGALPPSSFKVASVAKRETKTSDLVSQSGTKGKYVLNVFDNLRYASLALRGGSAAVDLALKKAANASIGRIKHRCKDLLLPGEIKTPFPEILKRKAS